MIEQQSVEFDVDAGTPVLESTNTSAHPRVSESGSSGVATRAAPLAAVAGTGIVSPAASTAAGFDVAAPSRPIGTVQVVQTPSTPRSSAGWDALCVFVSFLSIHAVYLNGLNFSSYRTVALFSSVVILMCALLAGGAYQTKHLRSLTGELTNLALCWLCAFAAIGLFAFLSKTAGDVSRVWVSASMLFSLFLLTGTRVIRSTVFTVGKDLRAKNVVVYGTAARMEEVMQDVVTMPRQSVRIAGAFEHTPVTLTSVDSTSETPDDTAQAAIDFIERERRSGRAIEEVWIALAADQSKYVEDLSDRLSDSSVDVCVVSDRYTDRILDGEIAHLGGARVVNISDVSLSPAADQTKRVMDTVLCSIGMLFLFIPMAVIALLVKLESPGPVIFKQKRFGVDGKEIEVLKFRSMVVHSDNNVRQATKGDSRVTRIGRVLRATSLDELPQLLNVLQGSMSLVGPRPHAVAHNELWRHQIRGYMLRHKVRPGITGWAQVNGWRGETDTAEKMEQRVKHDLDYIRNWSPWLDIKIIFLTALKGLIDKNAY